MPRWIELRGRAKTRLVWPVDACTELPLPEHLQLAAGCVVVEADELHQRVLVGERLRPHHVFHEIAPLTQLNDVTGCGNHGRRKYPIQ